jgi:hypothetical protein
MASESEIGFLTAFNGPVNEKVLWESVKSFLRILVSCY